MSLNITILGLGAVGTSLGLALGTLDPKALSVGRPVITGWDAEKRAISDARGRLAIDRPEGDLAAAVRDADVIFVCVPFGEVRSIFAEIAPLVKHGSIVTDTTPNKAQVLAWASELLPTTTEFIGGHPLVAVGGMSIRDASADMLHACIYCLVPHPRTRQPALDGLETLISAIGAKPYYIDAIEHDSYIAAAGHLPLVVATALMQTVSQSGGWREIRPIAGVALLNSVELVGGDPDVATDALHSNAEALAGWIDRVIDSLIDVRSRLSNPTVLHQMLEQSHDAREDWLRSQPNIRPGEDAFHGNVQEVEPVNLTGMFFGRRPSRNRDKRK